MNDAPNEFQEWHGSMYPPTAGRVEVIRRSGKRWVGDAIAERWLHCDNDIDVMAWRPAETEKEELARLRSLVAVRV